MHLKNLGEISNALKFIGESTSNFDVINSAVENLSRENTLAVLSSTNLSRRQIETILSSKNLEGAELEAAVATATLSSSQEAAARSTTNLRTAFKGLGEQIKTAITVHPYIAVAAAILANYKKFAYKKQPYIQSIRLFCVCKQCTYYFKRKDMIPMT